MDALGRQDPTRVGPYRLLGRLGRGGMGQVYLAVDPLGSRVAVKVVHEGLAGNPEFRRRFEHEVAAARRVQSRYTVEVLAADPAAERPWMAATFVDAPHLRDVVATRGPLGTAETLYLAEGIAVALQAIHRAGIVHRDLKPANVLLASDGPKVIDFGIARSTDASTVTGTGVVAGSAGFMSPEQASGDPVGPASDVFSLGVLLHYAATGERLFGEGALPAVLYRITHDEPDLRALTDDRLRGLVRACLDKDPARRPTAAGVAAVARGELPPPAADPAAAPAGAPPTGTSPAGERSVVGRGSGSRRSRPRRAVRVTRAAAVGGAAAGVVLAVVAATMLTRGAGADRAGGAAGDLARAARPGASSGTSAGTGAPVPTGATAPTAPATTGAPPQSGAPSAPAVAGPPGGGLPAAPASGATSGRPTGGPASPTTAPPSRPAVGPSSSTTAAARPVASVALTAPGGLTATAWFGRLADLTRALGSDVSFQVPAGFAQSYPDRCALTVVFRPVSGGTAAVYALTLGSGWTGAENVPSQDVAADAGVVHQQLVVPPSADPTGSSYRLAGRLVVDGTGFTSGTYTLTRMTAGSVDVDWTFGGHRVRCSTA